MDVTTTNVAGASPKATEASPEMPGTASRFTAVSCRLLDIVVSATVLVALLPLFAVIAVAIKLDSRGRVVFRQRRFGLHERPFIMNKFRTMHENSDNEQHREFVLGLIAGKGPEQGTERPFFKIAVDTRITRVGRVLRKSSLDELPQLWNVLRGDMSLVGPRPPVEYEIENYPSHWFARFAVKPGVTGLWQVSGRSELTLEEMIALDVQYARQRSLWLNIKILARTVPVVLNGRGAA